MNRNIVLPKIPRISLGDFLFFIIWPFGSFINAISHFRSLKSKTIFWLFCIFFGFSFIISDDIEGGADSTRYALYLVEMHDSPFSFDALVSSFYNSTEGVTDVYQPLITWIVANFTDDPRWLFALFGAIFGFFYVQNLWLVFRHIGRKVDFVLFIFLFYFIIINPIWNINGVRMWTAAHVYFYGILLYFLNGNKKGLFWILASVLFHFSFMFPVLILFAYLLLPSNTKFYFIFFILSSLIKEINLLQVQESLSFLPDVFQGKVHSYTNENYAVSVGQSEQALALHVKLGIASRNWILYGWVILCFIKNKEWLQNRHELKILFNLGLFLGGFAQIASLVPSGSRFFVIAHLIFFTVFVLLLALKSRPALMTVFANISAPFLILVIIFLIRFGTSYFGFYLLFGNPLINVFIKEQVPLIDFVKQFIE